MQIISLSEAKIFGLKRYFTGEPCKHGHIAERLVNNRNCNICQYIKKLKHNRKNREIEQTRLKKYYARNAEKVKTRVKKYRVDNPEKVKINNKHNATMRRRLIGGQVLAKIFSVEIKQIYQNKLEEHDVDHIIPLRNPTVCGLHVPWNLQYLVKSLNNTKGNKFNQDDESLFLDNRPAKWWENV